MMEREPRSAAPLRRDQALAYIIEHIVRNGSSPTNAEIGVALGGISGPRVRELVDQLIKQGRIAKTAGLQRNLRVVDVADSRHHVVDAMRKLGWDAADPMGEMPFPQEKLPRVPRLRQRPEDPGEASA